MQQDKPPTRIEVCVGGKEEMGTQIRHIGMMRSSMTSARGPRARGARILMARPDPRSLAVKFFNPSFQRCRKHLCPPFRTIDCSRACYRRAVNAPAGMEFCVEMKNYVPLTTGKPTAGAVCLFLWRSALRQLGVVFICHHLIYHLSYVATCPV